jgi:hypothetical protein
MELWPGAGLTSALFLLHRLLLHLKVYKELDHLVEAKTLYVGNAQRVATKAGLTSLALDTRR